MHELLFTLLWRIGKKLASTSMILGVVVTVCYSSGRAGEMDAACISLAESRSERSSYMLPKTWDTRLLSDPKKHDPNNFAYIVRTLNLQAANYELNSIELGKILPWIFSSLVTNDNFVTAGKSGLILDLRPENVVGTSCVDTHFGFRNPWTRYPNQSEIEEGFQEYRKRYGILEPSTILRGTFWSRTMKTKELEEKFGFEAWIKNNEILLRGASSSG